MSIARYLRYAGTLAIIGAAALFFSGRSLPSPSEAEPLVLRSAPLQSNVDGESFERSYGDIVYAYTPRAEYEISGIVVSLHHSDSFIDITHEYDPANALDLCLVWGENVASDAYRKVEYSHGDFTCFYRWWGEDPGFRGDLMSNTHIVPKDDALLRLAKSVRVGDQITLKGKLVDYRTTFRDGREIGRRNTSMVREDTGNGACEILYLEDLRVLKRHQPWREPLTTVLFFGGILAHLLALVLYVRYFRSKIPLAPNMHEPDPDPTNPLNPMNYARAGTEPKREGLAEPR
jgi:hypothetical protein